MAEFLSGEFFVGLLLVLATNIVLSGDNAVVIAMAARSLRGAQRRRAIVWGAVGAVVLRLIFAAVVAYLLAVPFLQAVGGILLVWIAWRLVHDDHDGEGKVRAGTSVWDAIRVIIVADAVMSLDNVIALVGAADGDFVLLAIGIATTIPLVVFGAALLAFLLDRFPVLVYAGAGLLVYVAVEMLFQDRALHGYLEPLANTERLVAALAVAAFLATAWAWTRRTSEAAPIKKGARRTNKEP